jgi:hypothetical protein
MASAREGMFEIFMNAFFVMGLDAVSAALSQGTNTGMSVASIMLGDGGTNEAMSASTSAIPSRMIPGPNPFALVVDVCFESTRSFATAGISSPPHLTSLP